MLDKPDPEALRLIGLIYDSVINPEAWHDALDGIRRAFGLHNSELSLSAMGPEPFSIKVAVNVPQVYRGLNGPEYSMEAMRLWGGPEQISRIPLEEPVILSSVSDRANWHDNKYYLDYGVPQGLNDIAAIFLTRDRRRIGAVAFGQLESSGPIVASTVDGLRVLAPHLRRAAIISGILETGRAAATTFEGALDATRSGVALVDADLGIVHANAAARAMLDAGDPLILEAGRLELVGELVAGQLEAAINAAAEGDARLGRRGLAIPAVRKQGAPFVAHVMPLENRSGRAGLPLRAVAAVFVAEDDEEPQLEVDAVSLLYGLTPMEARVFELIVKGHTTNEMAAALSIAPSTLKTHTLRLFDKTGRRRRSELVRLAAQVRPPG